MQRYWNYAREFGSAAPAPGCAIEVFEGGTLTLATLFADNGDPATPKANPFLADASDAYFYFYAAPGRYDVRLSGASIVSPYTWGDILLIDGAQVAYTDRTNIFDGPQHVNGTFSADGAGIFGTPQNVVIDASGKLAGLSSQYVSDLNASALTTLNASALASGTVPGARLGGIYPNAVTLANAANALAGASLSLGSAPSSTGPLRLTYNEAISWRNQAGNGDVAALRLGTDDYLVLHNATVLQLRPLSDDNYNFGESSRAWRNLFGYEGYLYRYLRVGPGDWASAGAIRLPNNLGVNWRNAAGNGDVLGPWVGTDDKLHVDPTLVTNDLAPNSDNDEWLGESGARYGGAHIGTLGLHVGTNPAQSGIVRLSNAGKVVGRNAANNADVDLFALDAADTFRIYRVTRYDGPQSTAGGTALLGTNCPASTVAAPYTWFEVRTSDGSVGFIPVWK